MPGYVSDFVPSPPILVSSGSIRPGLLGACLGISIQVTSMDDQSVQVASIRPQCLFAPIPAA